MYRRAIAVVGVTEESSSIYADGVSFGHVGMATMRRLRLEHGVDPAAHVNRSIVDLVLADRDTDGLVHFNHGVAIVQPAGPAARNGWVLVDIANRGGPTASMILQMDDTLFLPQPPQPPPGDGYLLARAGRLRSPVGSSTSACRPSWACAPPSPAATAGTSPAP